MPTFKQPGVDTRFIRVSVTCKHWKLGQICPTSYSDHGVAHAPWNSWLTVFPKIHSKSDGETGILPATREIASLPPL
jgi:hypothetical protein